MKILVPIKRVADPDNANKVKVSGDGTQITSEGLEWKMNPFDEWSLETALRLTEDGKAKKRDGEVVVVSVGPKDATQTIRQGLAMGAERGILVEGDDNALDGNMVAEILKAVVEKEQPDVVLLGKQTVDGDSNVVGSLLAEKLGWPMANYAAKIATDDGGKSFTVMRDTDAGALTVKISGPVVLTITDRILHPVAVKNGVTPDDFAYPESEGGRYASLKGIMQAKKKPIDVKTAADLGVSDLAPKVKIDKIAPPPKGASAEMLTGSTEEIVKGLVGKIKELGLL